MSIASPHVSVAPGRSLRRPGRAVVAVALAAVVLLGACGSEEQLGGEVVEDGQGCTISEVDRRVDDPPAVEAVAEVPETTKIDEIEEPDEEACGTDTGTYLTVDLVGATAADGTPFTTTYEGDRPLTVRLGAGQLIAGLETGLASMKVGGRRQITVPAAEAYGADGNEAQGIGADADLVFVVDLLSVTDTPVYCNEARDIPAGTREGKPTEVAMPVEAPTDEVVTTVLTEGDGPVAETTSYLTVEYLGVSCGTGQQFDSSWDREEPITIALVDAEETATAFSVIPGWSEGLVGQEQGSTVQVDIPFADAYGAAGREPTIGPSDPLTFIVQIVEVSDEAPPDPAAETTTTVAGDATTTTAAQ